MADATQAETEALLPCPFCGSPPVRFTIEDDMEVANVGGDVIACTKCQCSTRVFFGEKVGIEEAWNTRAAVLARMSKPEVGADDEALIEAALEAMALYVRSTEEDEPQVIPYLARKKAALRDYIQGVRERARLCAIASLQWENRWALKEAERMELHVELEDAERDLAQAEAALAACRDKTIEECAAVLKAKQKMLIDVGVDSPVANAFQSAIGVLRALKSKENGNG